MKIDKSFKIVSGITAVICVAVFIASRFISEPETEKSLRPHIRSILELDGASDTSRSLVVGYNYHLLEMYAENDERTIDIRIREKDACYLDSLRMGSIDLLVLPFRDSLRFDSLLVSRPVDSLSVWVMREEDAHDLDNLNEWLDWWESCEEYEPTRDAFLKRYNAFKSRSRDRLSPYDEIIKMHADSLGWDWRMLAAIIYQESRFHIEAKSVRGASGLMQMMPRTARHYGVQDPLNPEDNIRGGAQLLSKLLKRYSKVAADSKESFKYALAAYNAGIGRVYDIIRLAELRGVDTSHWDNVIEVIPEMNDEAVVDTGAVRLGVFKGTETIYYVDRVISIYDQFRRICPEKAGNSASENPA